MGVKWLDHEADHSPPSSAKVKSTWALPPWYLIKLLRVFEL